MSVINKVSKIYRALNHGETLVKELHTQFKEGRNCDLEIRLNRKRLYVHKCLIDTFFIKAGAELEDDRFYLDLSCYSQHVVEALVGLVYTGDLRCSLDYVENVYKAAIELGFVEAQTGCMTYLREFRSQNILNEALSSESILPEPFPVEYNTEPEPNVVIKTEPVEGEEESVNVNELVTRPVKKTDYRSTVVIPVYNQSLGAGPISSHSLGAGSISSQSHGAVPISSQSLGAGLISSQRSRAGNQVIHYSLGNQMNSGSIQTSTSYSKVNNVKPLPSLPAEKISRPIQKKTIVKYVFPKKSSDTTAPDKNKKGRQPKVACLEKEIVDKIKNLSDQSLECDIVSSSKRSVPESKSIRELPKKQNVSVSTKGTSVEKVSSSKISLPEKQSIRVLPKKQNISAGTGDPSIENVSHDEKKNLVEYRTKSGAVYYKYANPNSVSFDEFSVDTETEDTSKISKMKASEKSKLEKQTGSQDWMERVSTIVKTESEESDISQATSSTMEEEQEAQKKEQMFSLGLTKTVDKTSTSIASNGSENPGKRKLRARKKVDYLKESIELSSDFDDEDCDYNPYCENSKKRIKLMKGKGLKLDPSSLPPVTKEEDFSVKQVVAGGSKTIAVRQDLRNINEDDDDGYEETAYFPPAGSVPEGVRSRYAQGKYMKVKYVTESIRDIHGNITVVTKAVPKRPRQFGMDERLMNRPSVYVCHPTAPVVKKKVNRKQTSKNYTYIENVM